MAAIVLDDVTALCPNVTSVPALVLSFVNGNGIAVDAFDGESGDTTKMVRCLLAAHLTTVLGDLNGAAGAITSETEGGISRSYATLVTNQELGATGYGVQLLMLMRMSCMGGFVAGGGDGSMIQNNGYRG